MTTMTNQKAKVLTVDEGAIYELSFTYGWNKPAEAYRLTKGMSQVADYACKTFHKVVIRETGEILSTREFKRTFNKYRKAQFKGVRTNSSVTYKVTVNNNFEYYKMSYYITQVSEDKMRITVTVKDNEKIETIVSGVMDYSEDNYTFINNILKWMIGKNVGNIVNYNSISHHNYKWAVINFFNR